MEANTKLWKPTPEEARLFIQDTTAQVRAKLAAGEDYPGPPGIQEILLIDQLKTVPMDKDTLHNLETLWNAILELSYKIERNRKATIDNLKSHEINAMLIWHVADLVITKTPSVQAAIAISHMPFHFRNSFSYEKIIGQILHWHNMEGLDKEKIWENLGDGAAAMATCALTERGKKLELPARWYAKALKTEQMIPIGISLFQRIGPEGFEEALGNTGETEIETKNLIAALEEIDNEHWRALSPKFLAKMMGRGEKEIREIILAKGLAPRAQSRKKNGPTQRPRKT